MASQRYTDQLERMKRYFARFKRINDGKAHDQPSPNYDDEVYAFFQNCYHLKDWIKNDPACSRWSNVEDLINTNADLSICADLCNALKHLTLTKPRSSANPAFSGSQIALKIGDGFEVKESVDIAIKYKISTSSGEIDAFELAERCVAAWESFINSNANAP
jgi:hypothetical protein